MICKPIIATLGYVLSSDAKRVLMVHRNKREADLHFGKYNGLGGKVDRGESVTQCMKREILEESGLVARHMILRGTISWPGFGRDGEDWFGFIFLIDDYSGEAHEGNHEGTLEWVDRDKLDMLPLWESDKLFLPMVFDGNPATFHGVMPYHEGNMQSWSFERI
jgi:8-oxo-dGTP diphosphatase